MTELRLLPQNVPNGVNLVLHFTDADLAATGGTLKPLYYAEPLGRWVELPGTVNPAAHTITVSGLDVSTFAQGMTRLALMG